MILNSTTGKKNISTIGADDEWRYVVNKIDCLRFMRPKRIIRLMKVWAILIAFCFCWQSGAFAQSNAPAATQPKEPPYSKRYLFVLETSKNMQKRSEGTLQAIQNLLSGGIGGQLHRGDTIGVWTFDTDLHAGSFPLQRWAPDMHRSICLRLANFIKEQKYQGAAKFDKVLPAMASVIKDSPLITVIFISDGNQDISGTPFDDRINESFKMWKSEQQSARMPLITVLRGVEGKLTQFTVNPAQWQIEVPSLPEDYQKAMVAKVVTNAPVKPAPLIGQPLILTGKKPTEAANSVPAGSNTPTTPARPPETEKSAPQPVTPQSSTAQSPPVTASAPGVSASLAGPDASAVKSVNSPTETSKEPIGISPSTISESSTPSAEQTKPVAQTQSPGIPASNPSVGSPEAPAKQTDTSKNQAATAPAPEPKSAAPQKQMTRSAEAIVPASSSSLFPNILLWIALGIVVLLLVGGVIVLRRTRSVSEPSLITRSIDRRGER